MYLRGMTEPNRDALIGENVHQILWRRRIPQSLAARRTGMTGATLSRKLRGERAWYATELMDLSGYLDVPLDDLLPRLDSNQEPAGYRSARIIPLRRVAHATAA